MCQDDRPCLRQSDLREVARRLLDSQERSYRITNIDMFATFSALDIGAAARNLSVETARIAISRMDGIPISEVPDRRAFLWADAARIDGELDRIFTDMEGLPASSDKARAVLSAFDRKEATGQMPDEMPEERPWWLPQHGSWRQWMDIVDMMFSRRYSLAYTNLIKEIFESDGD